MRDIARETEVLEYTKEYYEKKCKTGIYKEPGKDVVGFWHNKGKYGVLSNWYMAEFEMSGIKFNCMEQLIMYGKAITFKNLTVAGRILKETKQADIKKYGRMVTNFDEKTWQVARDAWTLEGLVAKFCQSKSAEKTLLETGDKLIAECSPYDTIWGIGISEDQNYKDIECWRGKNLLGQYLMSVRYGINEYHKKVE